MRRALLDYAILGLLSQQPMTGYRLRRVFASTPMGVFSDSPGSIYPALARLQRDRLIRPSGHGAARPGSRVFEPTRTGLATLRRWLAAEITRDDVVRRIDELLLRFAFMDRHLDPRAVDGFLGALAEAAAAYAKELAAHARQMPQPPASTGRLARGHGIASWRATAQWARRARAEWRKSHGLPAA
ncbi:MAG: PadR family transcriptional regulator [Bryobacteraceae bacterium]